MEGARHSVAGADGVRIGLLTAGSGPALLLVHGGMGTINSWQRVWGALAAHRRVTAMDRRGRGSSGDADTYKLSSGYADVAAPLWSDRVGRRSGSGRSECLRAGHFGRTVPLAVPPL
jgi:pimeloyl-ACP methyl ester carboxylesterase